jgi:hypothetical protein
MQVSWTRRNVGGREPAVSIRMEDLNMPRHRIVVLASLVSTMLLASLLPSQGAPLMPTSPLAKSASANTDIVQVRYGGWGGWRGGWGGWRGGGWRGGWGGWGLGAGVLAGAAIGAAIAAPYYGGYPYDSYYGVYAEPYPSYYEAYAGPYPSYSYGYPGYYAGYYRPYGGYPGYPYRRYGW